MLRCWIVNVRFQQHVELKPNARQVQQQGDARRGGRRSLRLYLADDGGRTKTRAGFATCSLIESVLCVSQRRCTDCMFVLLSVAPRSSTALSPPCDRKLRMTSLPQNVPSYPGASSLFFDVQSTYSLILSFQLKSFNLVMNEPQCEQQQTLVL